jgi:2-hydroxy-6-oxonona-2,4-dienedioate hydrolase
MKKGKPMLWILPILLILFVLFLYLPYRRDIQKAYAQLDTIERQVLTTECGPIEVAIQGEGSPVLVSHGIGGGFDQGLGLAKAYLGDGYKVIAPSRFGYHATPLPADATPASQADAFVCLLDSLRIDKVTIMANSAGGTSTIQMALRHPERLNAIVFVSTAAPSIGEYNIALPPKSVIQTVFGSDFLMWLITHHFESAMKPAMGIPEGYVLSEEEQGMVTGVIRSVLPIERRTDGFVFDMFTSNLDMDRHPEEYLLETINVPTLVIHAVDDSLALYENAEALAKRIPHAELLSIPRGGHLLLSQEEFVRKEVARFIEAIDHAPIINDQTQADLIG